MMFLFINISLAQTADTAVKSDELQTTTTSVDEVGVAPTDSTPTLSKKELRRQRVAKRNLHYNILGGPSYTPDFGLLIGGSALMTFRMNPSDTTQQRSVVPMAIALMFEGGLNCSPNRSFSSRATASASSESSHIRIHWKISTASDTAPTRTIRVAKTPANTVIAVCR